MPARLLWGRAPAWTFLRIFLLLATCGVTFKLVLIPVRMVGRSMEPTFLDGQLGLVNRLAYLWHEPRRGDTVVFRNENDGPLFIKRIVGLPGERIDLHRGVVWINGQPLAEPAILSAGSWEWPEETLGSRTYFLVGDNLLISQFYREERSRIVGRPIALPAGIGPPAFDLAGR